MTPQDWRKLDVRPAEEARFYDRLVVGGCGLLWPGPFNNRGYGVFEVHREGTRIRFLTHRLSYRLATGVDPGPLVVRHGCDNPPCVTPDCLQVGTQADNLRDALERGRVDLSGLAAHRDHQQAVARQRLIDGVKRCSCCKVVKPLGEFHLYSRSLDGRQFHCKACRQEREWAGLREDQREALRRRRQPSRSGR